MNQLLFGAAFPFVAGLAAYAFKRFRASLRFLVALPLAMGACALWAVVPDLPLLLGHERLYHRLARDPRMDIFFWHHTIDQAEIATPWHLAALVVMAGCALFAAWRELRLREAKQP